MSVAVSQYGGPEAAPVGQGMSHASPKSSTAAAGKSIGLARVFASLAIRRPSETPEQVRGPFGLDNPLAIPAEPMVDFVFVHGLGGGSRKTWCKDDDPLLFWPKEWLPRDPEFKHVRIHSFGYDSDWTERRPPSILNIHDFGKALLESLQRSTWIRRSARTPIVFIAHSMGGLVVKKAYLLSQVDPAFQDIGARFHTIFFLATPHHGAHSAQMLALILKATNTGHRPFVDDLREDSPTLKQINDEFRHHAHKLHLFSFFETKHFSFGGLKKEIIVNEASAVMGYPQERSMHLDADHRGMCKFDSPVDPNYLALRNAFVETLDQIKHDCKFL